MQQPNFKRAKQIPNSLNFSQEQVTFILGHSLRSLYDDVLAAELLGRLKALVEQLENGHSPPSNARSAGPLTMVG
jgi:transcriptional regulator with XRE-family HTH domain